jgi:type I restriction enzyme M protein
MMVLQGFEAKPGYSTLFRLQSRDLTSEAEVETRLLAPLFNDLGYPATSIKPKGQLEPVIVHSGTKAHPIEVDFILFGSTGAAKAIVEAKSPTESVQDAWGQAASYAFSYNKDKTDAERIKWILISNGRITSLYKHDSNNAVTTLQLSDFASGSPPYTTLRSYLKYKTVEEVPAGGLPFQVTTPDELNKLFASCHQLIWKRQKMAPAEAFFEFCKFIFLKIREDKKREELGDRLQPHELPMTLAWLEAQRATSTHPVRDVLFAQLRQDLEDAITEHGKKRIFEPNEKFKLTAATTKELITRFEQINLSSLDEDLNGRMFEVFLNAAVRGKELGQYFTPRPLVDFMTRIALSSYPEIEQPPKVIDACCGTAGFLIEVMAYQLAAIRNDTRFSPRRKAELEGQIKTLSLFGVEGNERVSHIARINMHLHGDGGTHIFYGDGLDNRPEVTEDMTHEQELEVADHVAEVTPDTFDLALSNPPFSMDYSEAKPDEERILRQLSIADDQASVKSNILFLQRYHNLLKPGGQMLIVLDDTLLNGSTNKDVRRWIFKHFIIMGVHSMPFNAFFKAKANIKTSVLHVQKKTDEQDEQGHVLMSISNNIGHNNALADTPERNNLNDILNTFFQWRETGVFTPVVKDNQDPRENLECPFQVFLVEPDAISATRIDAFYYAPDLLATRADLTERGAANQINVVTGSDFVVRKKLTKVEKYALKLSQEMLTYIEIGDVTRYGLITKYITGTIDEIPTRAEYRIQTGDILMAINNSSRGTVVMVPEEFDNALCTSGFLVIAPRSQDEGHLLWYALRSEQCRQQVYYLAQTASQPELKYGTWLTEFQIPMPVGDLREVAIAESKQFQSHLREILNADNIRFS